MEYFDSTVGICLIVRRAEPVPLSFISRGKSKNEKIKIKIMKLIGTGYEYGILIGLDKDFSIEVLGLDERTQIRNSK